MSENSREVDNQRNDFWSSLLKTVIIAIVFQIFLRQILNMFSSKGPSSELSSKHYRNMFESGASYHLHAFIYEFDHIQQVELSEPKLVWYLPNLTFDHWKEGIYSNATFFHNILLPIDHLVAKMNLTINLLICVNKKGYFPPKNSIRERFSLSNFQSCYVSELTSFRKHNDQILPHWNDQIFINIIYNLPHIDFAGMDPIIKKHVFASKKKDLFCPILYHNQFWNFQDDYKPITKYNKSLNLNFTFYPLSLFKFQFYAAHMDSQVNNPLMEFTASSRDIDKLKLMYLETNPLLLALTVVVSVLHTVFEILAFKNDIQFWKTRNNNYEGLSLKSVLFGIFQGVVVLLYVIDNETNMMIIVGCLIGIMIDVWKCSQIFKFSFNSKTLCKGLKYPILKIDCKSRSYESSKTQEYDKIAFKYLGMALFPLMTVYGAYSVIYNDHKSIYSFVISMLYGFLLVFGFIMMTPQLFINYKLKSVAHLPWRMLTYKALNTFIDDIFAFVIRMPFLYRIGCLRDDVIFFIYLYQKWVYPTDMKRVNEFGTKGEETRNNQLECPMNDEIAEIVSDEAPEELIQEKL